MSGWLSELVFKRRAPQLAEDVAIEDLVANYRNGIGAERLFRAAADEMAWEVLSIRKRLEGVDPKNPVLKNARASLAYVLADFYQIVEQVGQIERRIPCFNAGQLLLAAALAWSLARDEDRRKTIIARTLESLQEYVAEVKGVEAHDPLGNHDAEAQRQDA